MPRGVVGRRGLRAAWECGGMAAAANGTARAWKGDGATILAARLTQTTCGRQSRCPVSDAPMTHSLRGRSDAWLPGIPFGGR